MDIVLSIITGVIGLVIFLCRDLIKVWIDKTFRAGPNAQKENLAAVRDSVLSGKTSRQSIVDQRRFDAVDQLSIAVRELDRYRTPSRYLPYIDLDYVFNQIDRKPEGPEFFKNMMRELPSEFSAPANTKILEHYLPDRVRELYDLYLQLISYSWYISKDISSGVNLSKFLQLDALNGTIVKRLPRYACFVETAGKYAWVHFAPTVRRELSLELRRFVDKTQADSTASDNLVADNLPLPGGVGGKILQNIPPEMKLKPLDPNSPT